MTNDQSRLGTSPVTGGFSLASSKPVAVTVIGDREIRLYKLEQFGLKEPK